MMMRVIMQALVAAVLLAGPAGLALAQQTVNLRGADIRAVIEEVSRTTGRTFIIDPDVSGKITIISDQPLSPVEYFELFLAALRANGYAAVPASGLPGAFRIVPVAKAGGDASSTRQLSGNSLATEVFPLSVLDAQSAADMIRGLSGSDGRVFVAKTGNAVIAVDYADNLARMRALLNRADRDSRTTRVVSFSNASARDVAATLEAVRGPAADRGAAFSIVAVDSSNSLVLRGDAATVGEMADLARQLDSRAEGGSDVRVVYLQHASADQVLPALQTMIGQVAAATSGGGDAPAASSGERGARVARFEGANALLISAPPSLQRALLDIVAQLDRRREQVLVEALIVEISDGAAQKLGVQFLLGGINGSAIPLAATNYSNTSPNLLAIAGAAGARELETTTTTIEGGTVTTTTQSAARTSLEQAAVSSVLGTSGALLGAGGKIGNDAIFAAVINAIKSDNASQLLSTPSVMTLDNQEASILVGQEIPITTGEALSDTFENAFRTVQRQDVGIKLEVRPQINSGGAVTMYLHQEVSSIAGPVSSNFNDLILNKREISTTVSVEDGQIIALGGLLDESERRSMEKIPFLGDIPGLGAFFRSKAKAGQKTNLMVFIRPTIVKDPADAQQVAGRRLDQMRGALQLQAPGFDAALEALARDYMGTSLPTLQPKSAPTPAEVVPEQAAP